ncbi:MAG: TIGR00725 family protein, partial [Proteobacteria bacterium]|nr:TIGR00725 family protein [Pseudomonadota bacterium]
GGGGGVMEAACRGFVQARTDASQVSVGILPSDNAGFANRFVDIAIPTGMGIARNAIIARTAWGLVAVGGCSGTLSEIALAWQLDRPIVALADSGGWAENLAGQAVDDRREDTIMAAETADEAMEILKTRLVNR